MTKKPPVSFGSVTGERCELRSLRTGENSFSASATGVSARSQVPLCEPVDYVEPPPDGRRDGVAPLLYSLGLMQNGGA